jgi:hypothetical protein
LRPGSRIRGLIWVKNVAGIVRLLRLDGKLTRELSSSQRHLSGKILNEEAAK